MIKIVPMVVVVIFLFSAFGVEALTVNMSELIVIDFDEEYDMVVIAPAVFSSDLQVLLDHKNSRGLLTVLKTVEEIYAEYSGRDPAEQIKYFIKDAVET